MQAVLKSKHNPAALSLAGLFIAGSAAAIPSITVDSVVQRWPWNNKVDITYTIAGDGGQDVKASQYCKVVFTATVNGTDYVLDGARDIVAWADNGTHTVTWTNAPAGVQATDCEMRARLYRTNGYYMVVDLDSGAYAFDDLADGDTPIATPTASNARYNTPLYKSDRMVLRRVPRTSLADSSYSGGYPTGDDVNYASSNGATTWTTDADYFIGVFEVTRGQLAKLGLADPSSAALASGTVAAYSPANNIPMVSSDAAATKICSGYATETPGESDTLPCFFPRLNAKTDIIGATGLAGFTLPTEVMWEIACRAGATTVYPWGDTTTELPTYCRGTTSNLGETGTKASNVWGLFDMIGNAWEVCPGTHGVANLEDAVSPWYRAASAEQYVMLRGGTSYNNVFHASQRTQFVAWNTSVGAGFRAAIIMK